MNKSRPIHLCGPLGGRGFTLVELLVSMVLLSIMALAGGSVYKFWNSQYAATERHMENYSQATTAIETISDLIAETPGPRVKIKETLNATGMSGRRLILGVENISGRIDRDVSWHQIYLDAGNNLVHEAMKGTSSVYMHTLMKDPYDVIFSYDNPLSRGAVNFYLCLRDPFRKDSRSRCFTATAKWRNW